MGQWIEADYYPQFHCKCGRCRHTCCAGWQIDITQREYFRLIGMECSEKLHRKLEGAFAAPDYPTEQVFRKISPNWLGQCPMFDEDGMCMLQKECGVEALPAVCRYYPRSLKADAQSGLACCSGSCEAVIELLLKEDRLTFKTVHSDARGELPEDLNDAEKQLCIRCLNALQDRNQTIAERIREIGRLLDCDELPDAGKIPDILPVLLENSPELSPCLRKYAAADEQAEKRHENLMANHLLYVNFPFTDYRLTKADSIYGLSVLSALLNMCEGNQGDALIDAYAAVFHLAEHTPFYYNCCVLLRNGT